MKTLQDLKDIKAAKGGQIDIRFNPDTAEEAVKTYVLVCGGTGCQSNHSVEVMDELKKLGREDIMVCIGGVIPVQDYDNLYEHGAVAIFAPGTNIPEAGIKLLTLLIDRAKEELAEE